MVKPGHTLLSEGPLKRLSPSNQNLLVEVALAIPLLAAVYESFVRLSKLDN
jgi:hypothetical protein